MIGHSAVFQGLHHGNVGVVELDVFSYKGHLHLVFGVLPGIDHGPPVRQIRFGAGQVQAFAGSLGQMLILHDQGDLVKYVYVQILKHMGLGNIAETGNFGPDSSIQGVFAAADQDIRLDSHALEILIDIRIGFVFNSPEAFR